MRFRLSMIGFISTLVILGLSLTAQAATISTNAALQAYEGGYMFWEQAEGGIWVLTGDGQATYYPVAAYGGLPDNPVRDATPAGRYRPVSGFGKVWGNFPQVRAALGWALAPEQGYRATIREQREIGQYVAALEISTSQGQSFLINPNNNTWVGALQPPPRPQPSPTPSAAYIPPFSDGSALASSYQRFERGFMLWIAGTGDIFVFYDDGNYELFPLVSYTFRSDNPIFGPPPGRIRPIFGFGKVWGNFSTVRERLGWATQDEIGQLTGFSRSVRNGLTFFGFSLPSGPTVSVDPYQSTWTR